MIITKDGVFEAGETIASWDKNYYHPIALRFYDRAIPEMLRLMGAEPGATVMDAGCGPGVHSVRAARAGYRVVAVDFSERMLKEAQKRVAQAGVSDAVELQKGDLTKLGFSDASFSHIFSWGVLIHIREIERALDELVRILRPGGRLALYLTNRNAWDHSIERLARAALGKPLAGLKHLPMGDGIWYDMHGEKLWVWRIDSGYLSEYLHERGLRRLTSRSGEFSEIQRRLVGLPRRAMLRLNNAYYAVGLPPAPAAAILHIFEKAP